MTSFAFSPYSVAVPIYQLFYMFGRERAEVVEHLPMNYLNIDPKTHQEGLALVHELSYIVTDSLVKYQKWCKAKRIQPKTLKAGDIVAASYLDIGVAWREKPAEVTNNGSKSFDGIRFAKSEIESTPKESAFKIATGDPDTFVYILRGRLFPVASELPSAVSYWMSKHEHSFSQAKCTSLTMPMIDYEKPVDMTSLIGTSFVDSDGKERSLTEISSVISLVLDQNGVRAKAEFHALATKSAPRHVVFDKPFTLWIYRKGFSLPLLVAFLSVDSWNRPSK
jgi:hypothetical protein